MQGEFAFVPQNFSFLRLASGFPGPYAQGMSNSNLRLAWAADGPDLDPEAWDRRPLEAPEPVADVALDSGFVPGVSPSGAYMVMENPEELLDLGGPEEVLDPHGADFVDRDLPGGPAFFDNDSYL